MRYRRPRLCLTLIALSSLLVSCTARQATLYGTLLTDQFSRDATHALALADEIGKAIAVTTASALKNKLISKEKAAEILQVNRLLEAAIVEGRALVTAYASGIKSRSDVERGLAAVLEKQNEAVTLARGGL